MDYRNIETTAAEPYASSMIQTFRAIGYNLETAVADVIDNSISAFSKNIYLNSEWKGGESVITILDDGIGMNNDELVQAMRPGAKNPLDERNEKDLGRFGLGLKTASFSQCKKLIVVSKKAGFTPIYWIWDLDYVNKTSKWELIRYPIPEEFSHALDKLESGTLVVWTELDRIIPPDTSPSNEIAKDKFLAQMDKVKQHLAMTFHRFIEERTVKIHCWGHEIKPWNPFLHTETATQSFPEEFIGEAVMKGYVLPHKCHLTEETYQYADGINGWTNQQGFYVYRGKRLMIAGDWLGLFRKEEHYKLVRVQIDLPNKLDSKWQIDIKKSTARPPLSCREQIKSYAKTVRNRGVEVFRHRGKILTTRKQQEFQPLWLEKKQGQKYSFIVNRDHLMIAELKHLAESEPSKAIEYLLRFVEETVPTKSVFIRESEQGETAEPFEETNLEVVKTMIRQIYNAQKASGKNTEQIKILLANMEPFNNFPELIEIIEEI
ncbi:MAG: ATP-binding protein [Bacteroidales bacterium]|jgi:hypothetical protein|nr:ATP-binding protein [Bacteroidales bacterium]